jgi:Methyltransferase domain
MADASPVVWDAERVANWLRQAEGINRQLQPVSDVLFAAAALRPGERVLDVGCGDGPTTREAALAVGPEGRVTGLDLNGPMLAAGASYPAAPGAAPIEWVEADPVEWTDDQAAYDVVLSRFGVMFFSDPSAAFSHLAGAARPGGRLALATWARRRESAMFQVPYVAAATTLGLDDDLPDALGPFSMGDTAEIRMLLQGAGWSDVSSVVHRLSLPYGGAVDAPTAAASSLDFGPTRLITQDIDEDARARVIAAIAEALRPHEVEGTVILGGTVVVTTATRPS